MARSGIVTAQGTPDGNIVFTLKWWIGAYNTTRNATAIHWEYYIKSNSQYIGLGANSQKSLLLLFNGEQFDRNSYPLIVEAGEEELLGSVTSYIPHSSGESISGTISFRQFMGLRYDGESLGWMESGTSFADLSALDDTDDRIASIGNIANFAIDENETFVFNGSGYNYKLEIYISTTLIKTIEGITNSQQVSFTEAEKNVIYGLTPNVTSIVATYKLLTYEHTMLLGTYTHDVTLRIPANVKPSITSVTLAEAVAGINTQFGGYIVNQSKVSGTIVATAGTGATISSYQTLINGETLSGSTFTTANVLNGRSDVTVVVTDTRGRTDTYTTTLAFIPYVAPTVSTFTAFRCDENGDEDLQGAYVKLDVSSLITSMESHNTKQHTVEYKEAEGSTWTTIDTSTDYAYTYSGITSGISTDKSYLFRLSITDYFGTVQREIFVPTGFYLFDIHDSGKGFSLGKPSSRDAFQCGFDMYDKYDTFMGNGLAVYGTGEISADTTMENLLLTRIGTPTYTYYYVFTMFYANKTATANRTQIAFPYAYDTSTLSNIVYARTYINGTGWSSWGAANENTVATSGLVGNSLLGKNLSIQWATAIVTPTPNVATPFTVNFGRTYEKPPTVIPTVTTTNIGNDVKGVSVGTITNTAVTFYLTRAGAYNTQVQFLIVGRVS